ncbi:DgyrCDS3494 [Dimorphilus gyrociliatus]|uniref:DgyrCDS3494 n=1 Tax=Dimorphilus gyrociliatus TaxID=2664684 RepID=A0A7I8VIH6_9ANNE|nr:DgyrCDS3494 [Dimorphilus gyrociliatus]
MITHAQKLLNTRRDIKLFDSILEDEKKKYNLTMDELDRKKKDIEKKESELQQYIAKYNKLLKDNQQKIEKEKLKSSIEKEQMKIKKQKLDRALDLLNQICHVDNLIADHKIYETFLQEVANQSENFDSIDDMMNRYYSLKATHKDLMKRELQCQREEAEKREENLRQIQKTENEILDYNNHAAALQLNMEKARHEALRQDYLKEHRIKSIQQKQLLIGQIKLSISNLYFMTREFQKHPPPMTKDISDQIIRIKNFIRNLSKTLKELKKQKDCSKPWWWNFCTEVAKPDARPFLKDDDIIFCKNIEQTSINFTIGIVLLKDLHEDLELIKNAYRSGVCRIHSIVTTRKVYVRLIFEEVNSHPISDVQLADVVQISSFDDELALYEKHYEYFYLVKVMKPYPLFSEEMAFSLMMTFSWKKFVAINDIDAEGLYAFIKRAFMNEILIIDIEFYENDTIKTINGIDNIFTQIKLFGKLNFILEEAYFRGLFTPGYVWVYLKILNPKDYDKLDPRTRFTGLFTFSVPQKSSIDKSDDDLFKERRMLLERKNLQHFNICINGAVEVCYHQMMAYDQMKVATEALIHSLSHLNVNFHTVEMEDACSNSFPKRATANGLYLLESILNLRVDDGLLHQSFIFHRARHCLNMEYYILLNVQKKKKVEVGIWRIFPEENRQYPFIETGQIEIFRNTIFPGRVSTIPLDINDDLFNITIKLGICCNVIAILQSKL